LAQLRRALFHRLAQLGRGHDRIAYLCRLLMAGTAGEITLDPEEGEGQDQQQQNTLGDASLATDDFEHEANSLHDGHGNDSTAQRTKDYRIKIPRSVRIATAPTSAGRRAGL